MYYHCLKWLRYVYFLVSDPYLSQYWSKTSIKHDFNSCVTDGQTDIPSYRDAITHLKKGLMAVATVSMKGFYF